MAGTLAGTPVEKQANLWKTCFVKAYGCRKYGLTLLLKPFSWRESDPLD
jgi:hypothetical protein